MLNSPVTKANFRNGKDLMNANEFRHIGYKFVDSKLIINF